MTNLKGTEKQVKWANEIILKIEKILDATTKGSEKIFEKEKSVETMKSRVNKVREELRNIDDAGDIINKYKQVTYKKDISDILFEINLKAPRKLVLFIENELNENKATEVEFEKFGKTIKIVAKGEGLRVIIDNVEATAEVENAEGGWAFKITDKNIINLFTEEDIPHVLFVNEKAKEMQHYTY